MGVFLRNKCKVTRIILFPSEYYWIPEWTVPALPLLFRCPLHAYKLSQGSEPIRWKTLCHFIRYVVYRGDLLQVKLSSRYAFPDKVVPDFDVF